MNYLQLEKMIKSPDKENVYLAVSIIRSKTLNIPPGKASKLLLEVPLEHRIRDYKDICEELGEKELTLKHFRSIPVYLKVRLLARTQLEQIAKLVNREYKVDWKNKDQYKWYPYFEFAVGRGLVFRISHGDGHYFNGLVAFKDRPTSDFVGKTFTSIYEKLM